MQFLIKDSTGRWAQVLTKEQFDLVHDRLVNYMNSGKRIKDEDVLAVLSKEGKPVSFLSSVVMDVALYEDRPIMPFLGAWLGSDVAHHQELYNMVRDYFVNSEEHLQFDTKTDEEDQRTFLLLIALVEHAGFPR
jgi:hypothetical protein